MRPNAEAQSSARDRTSKRVRVRSIDVYSCAHRWVRQRMFYNRSTPQVTDQGLVRQAALNAATENEETAVRQELIDRLHCLNRRRARGTQRREGVRRFTVFGTSIFWWRLVML